MASINYLKPSSDRFQLMFGDLNLSSRHVRRLFGVKRIANASRNENVQLDAALAFLGLAFMAFLEIRFVLVVWVAGR